MAFYGTCRWQAPKECSSFIVVDLWFGLLLVWLAPRPLERLVTPAIASTEFDHEGLHSCGKDENSEALEFAAPKKRSTPRPIGLQPMDHAFGQFYHSNPVFQAL